MSPVKASGRSYEMWKLCAPPRETSAGLRDVEVSMRRYLVCRWNYLTKLMEGNGVGEALTSLVPATRSERGRMRLASFIVTVRKMMKENQTLGDVDPMPAYIAERYSLAYQSRPTSLSTARKRAAHPRPRPKTAYQVPLILHCPGPSRLGLLASPLARSSSPLSSPTRQISLRFPFHIPDLS